MMMKAFLLSTEMILFIWHILISIMDFSVNGVASLHTDILKETELNNFYKIYPEKFNNKTNGITFRRWLLHCNPALTALLDELDWRRI